MTPDEFRANARQCLRWAEQASSPDNREAFFGLATVWEAAALRLEQDAANDNQVRPPPPRQQQGTQRRHE
jgi:hypothetical protein